MIEKSLFPLDKLNTQVAWNQKDRPNEKKPKYEERFKLIRKNAPLAFYGIEFESKDDVIISRALNYYDKRVYLAIASLYDAGNQGEGVPVSVSLYQIYYAMGHDSYPNKEILERIAASITTMEAAKVTISTREIAAKVGDFLEYEVRETRLLPVDIQSSVKENCTTGEKVKDIKKTKIIIFKMPPLVDFAIKMKQYQVLNTKILHTKLRATESGLRLEDYVLHRICRAIHGKERKMTMSFATLYERMETRSRKQRHDLRKSAKTLFEGYEKIGLIEGFRTEETCFKIALPERIPDIL